MKKKKEVREIPFKNYLILLVVCIITVILTFYINAWIKTYKEHTISVSPLNGVVNEINLNELNEAYFELPDTIIYVGYTNDEKLYNEEKKLLKTIKKEEAANNVIYINVVNNDKYVSLLNKRFGKDGDTLKKAPAFICIKNGEVLKIVNVKEINNLNKTFLKIIDLYEN